MDAFLVPYLLVAGALCAGLKTLGFRPARPVATACFVALVALLWAPVFLGY